MSPANLTRLIRETMRADFAAMAAEAAKVGDIDGWRQTARTFGHAADMLVDMIEGENAMQDDVKLVEREGFAPCPTCKQYSPSIGGDKLAEAFNHFQSMYAHPVRGHPMGHHFDEKTRDYARVLVAAASALHVAGEREKGLEERFDKLEAMVTADLKALGTEHPDLPPELHKLLGNLALNISAMFDAAAALTAEPALSPRPEEPDNARNV